MSTFWIDKVNIEGSVGFHKGSRAPDQHGNLARTTPSGLGSANTAGPSQIHLSYASLPPRRVHEVANRCSAMSALADAGLS
jgi:hypothetical protein